MLSKFFLKRPVFAWVIAIVIMAAGGLAIYNLPISQYPPIAPPSIAMYSTYPGASAETVENSVTQIIEQKMTGFDNLLYMSATSDSAGMSRIELTFKAGTDPDIAWTQVQNKLQLAMSSLPEVVRTRGVEVAKSTRNYLMIVGLISEDGSMDKTDLSDFAITNLESVLARVPGVGEVEVFGAEYAMRIWVNPDRLRDYRLTTEDVIAALRAYNVEVSAGQFGGTPAVEGQRLNASIIVQNMLRTPDEFASVPIRINPDGSIVRVGDVSRIELGTELSDIESYYNGLPTTGIAIRQAAGANALDTAEAVKAKMAEMSRFFPEGLKVVYPNDSTLFIKVAIKEVVKTLFEAILLVFLIMLLFLGNMRATLIPTIAVPVVLLGTFAMLSFFGFSINMLTMFAMVLAIGLLVDDAIVVVENVERIMAEEGLPPREATAKSMEQITSALIGIGLVLSAVFGPMAFFPGSTGVIYRQFSITIIAAMLLSVVVALILTPVLCASLLKPVAKGREAENAIFFLRPFFRWFNRVFFRFRRIYVNLVGHSLSRKKRYLAVFLVIVVVMGVLYLRMPTAYLPDEDQGGLLAQMILPSGSTLEQTQAEARQIERYFMENEKEAVESAMVLSGYGFSGRAQNNGMVFIKMKDWELRDREDLRVKAVAQRATMALSTIRGAQIFVFPPPPVVELGIAKGFDFQFLDRGGLGHEKLMELQYQLLTLAAQDPRLVAVRPNSMNDVPQYRIHVDWEKAGALGVPITSIHNTIAAAFGSAYVNVFYQERTGTNGRMCRRIAPYRMLPKDLNKLYVRNTAGRMVPFSSFASGRWTSGSPRLARFNGFPAINIWGEPAPGISSGEAMQAMEEIMGKLPRGVGFDWAGLSFQEKMSSSQAPLLYAFSIFVIFLCLAALYESWTIPISILLILPLGVIGGIIATSARGLANDVYFQIGLLTTLGLATKNAILIVQFAKDGLKQGMGLVEATLEGAKLRFRPIIMTSLAFGFGVLPLAVSTGAGAGAMNAIGTSVLGGMVTATVLVVIFVPLFYVLIEKLFGRQRKGASVETTDAEPSED